LYTLSRGAIVTAGLVFGGWFLWMLKEKKIRVIVFTVVFMIFSSAVLIWANPQVYEKFATTIKFLPPLPTSSSTGTGGSGSASWGDEWDISLDASSRGRLERWGSIITVMRENPQFAVLGVGYSKENLVKYTGVSSTHSLFLDLWVRGGILALILAVGVWMLLFGTIFRFLFSRDSEVRTFGYLLGAFAIGWLLDNLISGEQFFSDAPMLAFWGVLGLVQALASSRETGTGRKKVLIALTSAEVGGAPQVVYDLLSQVRKRKGKKEFEFVVAAPQGTFVKKFRELGYKVYTVPLDRLSLRSCWKFFDIARKEEVDLINSHGKGAGLYARLSGTFLGVPVVQTFHGLHYSRRNPVLRFLYLNLEKVMTPMTKLVINVSKSQEREGIKLGIFPKRKSRVVVNGIESSKAGSRDSRAGGFRSSLGIGPKDFAAVMVARFDEVKAHRRFIKILPVLVKEVPKLKVIFAGGGSREKEMKRLVKELRVAEHTIFLGERKDVPKILQAADAFVLPSYHEGLPISVLEASVAGLPVIGSNVVGIKDAVRDGETGFLVDF
ncbi:MAG: glycosyltransferase, partial [bacterium]|nr:glycosyltransferase [bacterium]